MELGAFVVVPGGEDLTAVRGAQPHDEAAFRNARPPYSSRMPIVGNDVLQSWMDRIRKLGVQSLWLTSGRRDGTVTRAELAAFSQQGLERLLVIKLNSYAEMDLADLLHFHCQNGNPATEAHDARGRLGVCLLDQHALRTNGPENELALTSRERKAYQFNGYAKRILAVRERQELVGDALTGACAMRPFGKEIGEQVWIGEGVKLASSARIIGPTYIGAHTVVRAGATIGPFASVERDCVVDCGVTVERSTVLPHTYLAPGVLIRDGVVDGGYMEHLVWGTVADLQPAGLGCRLPKCDLPSQAPSKTDTNATSQGGSSVWNFAPCSAASTPWLQVQL